MKCRRILWLFALCCGSIGPALSILWAASGEEGASFLNIPVGAGPAALASAYTALANDAYAPVYNPAGLGFLSSTQIGAQHLTYLGTEHYEYLSAVHPFHAGSALGASIQYLGSGDIAGTDLQANSIGNFTASYASYNLAYGQMIRPDLSVGGTVKWVHAKLSDVTANAMAADMGALYKVRSNLTVATTLTNAGTKLTFLNDGDYLPFAWHVGASYRVIYPLLFTGEVVYRRQGPASTHVGMEWQVLPMAWWRVGYRTDTTAEQSQLAGFTTGLGLQAWGQEFSYAWVPLGDLGNTQYFSLVLRFGEAEAEKRNLIQFQHIKRHPMAGEPSQEQSESEELERLLNEGQNPKPKDVEAPAYPVWK